MVNLGFNMDLHQAYMVQRGLKTLGIRIDRSQEGAEKVAQPAQRPLKDAGLVCALDIPGPFALVALGLVIVDAIDGLQVGQFGVVEDIRVFDVPLDVLFRRAIEQLQSGAKHLELAPHHLARLVLARHQIPIQVAQATVSNARVNIEPH